MLIYPQETNMKYAFIFLFSIFQYNTNSKYELVYYNIANLQKEVEEFLQNEMSEENFEKYKSSIGDAMYKLEKKTAVAHN